MPSKYQLITEMAAKATQEMCSTPEHYLSFLTTAAQNYKYSFRDQLLIHAQMPEATACAEMATWNKLGRWINKGSKGIALLNDESAKYRLRYVFDVSATNSYARQTVQRWEMQRRYESEVSETLQNNFGEAENTRSFPAIVGDISAFAAQDNLSDYLTQLMQVKPGSLLDEYETDSLEQSFTDILGKSIAYMTLVRCGYDANDYFLPEEFENIRDYDTPETASVFGGAARDISEMLLREVEKTVISLQRTERNGNRTFENNRSARYNDDRNKNNERSSENGTELHDEGRLPDPRPDSPREPDAGQIRHAEAELSEEPPERDIHGSAAVGQAERTSGGDGQESLGDDGNAHSADEEDSGRDREAEGRGSDALDTDDEQHTLLGGGDSPVGADLQLTAELPSEEEQKEIIAEAEAEKTSAFTFSQEDIDAVLTRGSGIVNGKFRIYEQFLKNEGADANAEFLKNEYGTGGAYPKAITERGEFSEDHDAKGIRISTGFNMPDRVTTQLPWKKAAKRIAELIAAERYLSQAELTEYPQYLADRAEREARKKIGVEFRDIVYAYNDYVKQLGEDEKKLQLYYMSECWNAFMSGQKKMHARTMEGDFVLPLMRNAIQSIIDDNTPLTERCEAMLAALSSDIAKKLEPTYDELNPPPEPEKEYRVSLGDTVYIGVQEYEVIRLGEDSVELFDSSFPLLTKTLSREVFNTRISENPLNNKYLQVVEVPSADDPALEKLKEAINAYCRKEFESDGDFSDLNNIGLAYTTSEDETHEYQVSLNISELKILLYVDNNEVGSVQFKDLDDVTYFIDGIDFNELISMVEDEYERIQPPQNILEYVDSLMEQGYSEENAETAAAYEFTDYHGEEDEIPDYMEADTPEEPNESIVVEPPPAPKRERTAPYIIHPEITERSNYRITDDELGVGTPSERYRNNIEAIKLLKTLEAEGRLATVDEQTVLSKYVGWGGLSDCFEERSSHYLELKGLLTSDEYEAARESTLTAFYTPPVVIKAMYKALDNLGFKNGNILEPSCGVGNFMGLIPENMAGAKLYGIELDSISGRIAQQLYQENSIAVQGFEKTELPDSFFDCAIGNVPFGQFKVPDKRYDRYNFLIHDYFFARTLDKVRPGGVVAFITSKGTMDKENPSVRKYIAQRAELLGAIRLPDNTFKSAAGTEVTADIIFLQKRDTLVNAEPDWVHLGLDANGLRMNQYFIDRPDMILGEMREVSGPYGPETACVAFEDTPLAEQLSSAVQNIQGQISEYSVDDVSQDDDLSIPADLNVRNYSYALIDGKIYFRENSRMNPVDVSSTAQSRIKGMISIRDSVRQLIEYQIEDYPDSYIKAEQEKLNSLYDEFTAKYGLINSRGNSTAFSNDSSYFLLTSLEVLDDEGNFLRKADMFSKRTIKQRVTVTSVDTASEALALSLAEKARIDIPFMVALTGKTEDEICDDLRGVIFLDPLYSEDSGREKYLPADEYLSGNVREKLAIARKSAELDPERYTVNVQALEAVQPVDLTASEISVRLGATWIPPEDIEEFMFALFGTAYYMRWNIHVRYSAYTGEWSMEGKSYDKYNVRASSTYGTERISGYKILEETLNLRDVRIFDYVEDGNGKRTAVLNKKETAIAQGKQEAIKQAFVDWIWAEPERRSRLTKLYNEKFNSVRPREYDGSHLNFSGMNPEIKLRKHQVDAIAHILYGGNTLLAHVVGAGKTFEMVAAAQESKRLGLCHKSLFVVPNHLTEQWASEYLQLYPSANILVATRKDFETKNRKKFCSRIATGDYDAVIIGHSQFEKIPMSVERQRYMLEQQLQEIMDGITELKANRGDKFSVKALEKTKKTIKLKLEKLNDQSRKDDVITFEELGIDRLFIDEAHYYKNLAAYSKMRNVGGISQTEAMKSSDLYMKCRYLDELTGGRGVVFATGTPISNSMVEMYTMQKYLQYGLLKENGLINFDAWAATFGETVTAIELAPEGTGYRAKTRFSRFYNLPELMCLFKQAADIQTADMLQLPVPKANYHNVVLKPSERQIEMVKGLSDRAERVRNKMVSSDQDNMLLITNDGRKLALDQRLMNDMLPDSETGKISACAQNVYEIWQRTADKRSTQMVFCDLSTPHGDGKFNVYDNLREKLIAKGIPADEIAYIHSAETEAKKKELFGKVRSGQIRVLLGSTQKMGAGTNVQQKLIALHHLDCPWRPSDLQQREGRIVRQGNENPEVEIFTYVTENTFDSYLYQLVESKQKFIGQIMTSKSPVRSAEDIDETALSYAEIKALCTGNPYIKEKMDLDIEVSKLKLLKASHLSQRYALEDKIIQGFPKEIASLEQRISGYTSDIALRDSSTIPNEDGFSPMTIEGTLHTEKKAAGSAILAACKAMTNHGPNPIGQYRGFKLELYFEPYTRDFKLRIKGTLNTDITLSTDIYGNIQRIDNALSGLEEKLTLCRDKLDDTRAQLERAKLEVQKPFSREDELKQKTARLDELNIMLNMDKRDNEIVDGEHSDEEPQKDKDEIER